MRIQHNIMAMNAYRNYTNNTSALSKNLEKLSSGYKINRAGDDAAGLAISEKMRAQITGLETAQKNAKDGISLVQTAEGALTEVHDMLNRMVELADQSANGTYDDETDRDNLQKEFAQLKSEIDRIADSSNFNGIKLLDGSMQEGNQLDTSTTVFSANATTSKAGIDVSVQMATQAANKSGTDTDLSVKFALASGSATAKVDNSGAVTITLKKGVDYTAADIQELLAKVTTTASKVGDDILNAIKEAKVTGTGITDAAGKTAVAALTGAAKTDVGSDLTLQIGDTSDSYNQLTVSIQDMHVDSLGLDTVSIGDQAGAQAAVDAIKNAINTVSSVRGTLGATQNRLDHTINNLSVMTENIQDAESTIRDTDVADEMMAYTKNNILVQSAQAMLAQANQVPQGVLQLLQ